MTAVFEHTAQLAAVVRAVVDDVNQNLPKLHEMGRAALDRAVIHLARQIGFGQRPHKFQQALMLGLSKALLSRNIGHGFHFPKILLAGAAAGEEPPTPFRIEHVPD